MRLVLLLNDLLPLLLRVLLSVVFMKHGGVSAYALDWDAIVGDVFVEATFLELGAEH